MLNKIMPLPMVGKPVPRFLRQGQSNAYQGMDELSHPKDAFHKVSFGMAGRNKGPQTPPPIDPSDNRECTDCPPVGDFVLGMETQDPYLRQLTQWNDYIYKLVTKPRPTVDGKKVPWLKPLPTHFYMVDSRKLMRAASQGGFLSRYPHWRFDRDYYYMKKQQDFHLSKLYELVVNNNPSIAYMLNTNDVYEQAVVMAHVYGHTDFFNNNVNFSKTNRHIVDTMGDHARRIQAFEAKYGKDTVEKFLDKVHTMEWLADTGAYSAPDLNKETMVNPFEPHDEHKPITASDGLPRGVNYILPRPRFPHSPDRDVMGFLYQYGHGMADWQRDILAMLREESYYFLPQVRTKVMNEGWATFWHEKLMKDVFEVLKPANRELKPLDIVNVLPMMEGVKHPGKTQINPYRLGSLIYKDIEEKANEAARRRGIKIDPNGVTPGIQAAREVMEMEDDRGFISNYLTDELIEREQMYKWVKSDDGNDEEGEKRIASKDPNEVRQAIINQLGFENPAFTSIAVVDSNFNNRGELLLKHYPGVDLRTDWAKAVLRYMAEMWGAPAHLDSIYTDDEHPENQTHIRFSTKLESQEIKGQRVYYISPEVLLYELDDNGIPIYEISDNGKRQYVVDPSGNRIKRA